ncbi:PepSY domain-containing protein [Mobilicoccus massiliensis]|uniref:PepSY domain-containing protein n=1 Tax=Mobilicoccus massiliensis TaxID=1522310 RepID=UPI001596DDF9|nr:PepSY domain-containing protein [Mobilicoccus massiliensis]
MRKTPLLATGLAALLTLSACGGGDQQQNSGSAPAPAPATSAPASTSAGTPTESGATSSAAAPASSAAKRDVIAQAPQKSWQDALTAAKQAFPGNPSKIELESRTGGSLEYKVELYSDTEKYAVQYDADSLQKLSEKREKIDADDKAEAKAKTFDPTKVVPLDAASRTALSSQDGTVTKWKIEGKDTGRVQYEFDILPAGSADDREVQVDAMSGNLL